MSKQAPKARHAHAKVPGIYKTDSVRDVAESLNIINISDIVASALASDVEYRIQQVVEEAARFMRHAKRTTLTTADIDQALRVLNIEPLYGHFPYNPPTFRRALPFPQMQAAGPVYFIEDEEIEFDRVLREEKVTLPKGVTWTAHWLAVEGVQPLIPENPPAVPREIDPESAVAKQPSNAPGSIFPPTPPSSDRPSPLQPAKQQPQQHIAVKQVLSRELQLYYTRLTSSLLPPTSDFSKRTAALASLRQDAGLSPLLPYLVRWVGQGVVDALRSGSQNENDGRVLEVLLDVIDALLGNQTLGVEPYLHQLLPSIFSILLHSALPPSHAAHLRTAAAQILSHLLTHYSTTYPGLSSRIVKTLIVGLIGEGKSRSTREGAIRGLMGIGKEAVRQGLVKHQGAKIVGDECMPGESSSLVDLVIEGFTMIHPPSLRPTPLNPDSGADASIIEELRAKLGNFFAERLIGDSAWARGILSDDAPDA